MNEQASTQSWRIGAVTITKIVESEVAGDLQSFMPHATPDAVADMDWLKPDFMTETGDLRLSFHALFVETPELKILVDTCVGNDKVRVAVPQWNLMQTAFLDTFKRLACDPRDVDIVLCTHMHVDHVGWNTCRVGDNWAPTFPNARYLVSREEFDHWAKEQPKDSVVADPFEAMQREVYRDSVEPVLAAGLLDLVPLDHQICREVRLRSTAGHTPGHVSVEITSEGEHALITGDFVHHPCQLQEPDWGTVADHDLKEAAATRRRVLEELADGPVLVIGTHWAGRTAGHIQRQGPTYRLR